MKYLARSFLLPLVGLLGVLYLAFKYPTQWKDLWIPGGLAAAFAGIFNLNEAFKTWALRPQPTGLPGGWSIATSIPPTTGPNVLGPHGIAGGNQP